MTPTISVAASRGGTATANPRQIRRAPGRRIGSMLNRPVLVERADVCAGNAATLELGSKAFQVVQSHVELVQAANPHPRLAVPDEHRHTAVRAAAEGDVALARSPAHTDRAVPTVRTADLPTLDLTERERDLERPEAGKYAGRTYFRVCVSTSEHAKRQQ